jgi:hypothetical protein
MAVGVVKATIKFTLNGRKKTLDFRQVPFKVWPALKAANGFTQRTLVDALIAQDVEAIVALIWLERTQRERKLRYIDVFQEIESSDDDDDIEVYQLIVEGRKFGDDEPDTDDEDAEGEDPTTGSS